MLIKSSKQATLCPHQKFCHKRLLKIFYSDLIWRPTDCFPPFRTFCNGCSPSSPDGCRTSSGPKIFSGQSQSEKLTQRSDIWCETIKLVQLIKPNFFVLLKQVDKHPLRYRLNTKDILSTTLIKIDFKISILFSGSSHHRGDCRIHGLQRRGCRDHVHNLNRLQRNDGARKQV